MGIITAIHITTCILLIIIVLLQHSKGADLGATFGGSGNTVFGASGADNLFTKITTALAAIFMITSIVIASNVTKKDEISSNIFKDLPNKTQKNVKAKTSTPSSSSSSSSSTSVESENLESSNKVSSSSSSFSTERNLNTLKKEEVKEVKPVKNKEPKKVLEKIKEEPKKTD